MLVDAAAAGAAICGEKGGVKTKGSWGCRGVKTVRLIGELKTELGKMDALEMTMRVIKFVRR